MQISQTYLLQSTQLCYMCGEVSDVFCLAADGYIDDSGVEVKTFVQLYHVTGMDKELEKVLRRKAPRFYLDYTKRRHDCHYMNHCRCGTKLTDFHLHNQSGGAFYTETNEQEKPIQKLPIALDHPVSIHASCTGYDAAD